MSAKCTIDIYSGEAYDRTRHVARELFWSDDSFRYWGWLYNAAGEVVGGIEPHPDHRNPGEGYPGERKRP